MVKIKEIPINDRPMERLIRNGVETLDYSATRRIMSFRKWRKL